MIDPIWKLALGLLTGFFFGFLLQKGQVTKYRVILGQFLLRDFTMLKIMLTAVVVGGFGVFVLRDFGVIESLHIKPMILGSVITGGAILGIGMGVLGYCPGTLVAAIAEGSRHAIFGLFGALLGAVVYAEGYPFFKHTLLALGDFGKITLNSLTGGSPYLHLVSIAVLTGVLFAVIEHWERAGAADKKADG